MENHKYCGQDLCVPFTDFKPKSRKWDSMDFLQGICRSDIRQPDAFFEGKKEFFLHAAFTEFDAENLCRHLDTLHIDFSPEFFAFERLWRRDEYNHYMGFRRLYSIIYNEQEQKVAEQIESRPYDFSSIGRYFNDEFLICLIIAYDEILTTKSYSGEQEMYNSFGSQNISQWIKEVTRDESYHFRNAMEVIRINHSSRIPEVEGFIESLIQTDLDRNDYKGTFVLDHDWYSVEFLRHGASIIKHYFEKNAR